VSVLAYSWPDQAYRRSARLPIWKGPRGAYRVAMTTYNTPHFATGNSDLRSEPPRTRPASAVPYRNAGVANEAAAMRDGPTPDWQPGASKGVPKAAIGAVGAALVGGVALAIVLMAPSNKVTKVAQPGPVAQAKAETDAAQKSVAATDAAVNELDRNAPAAGNSASQAVQSAQEASAVAVPAAAQNVVPDSPPVSDTPAVHAAKHAAPRAAPQRTAPAAAKTDTSADVPAAAPPADVQAPAADVQAPAMHQTPDTPTVTPSVPATAPTTPDTPAQAPAP